MIGARLSHYRILEKVGEGGMGEVFVALDESLQRRVAIKAIRPDRHLDEVARQRLMREARNLSSLDHPGVCKIFDYLRLPEGDFLVLEFIQGRSLHEVLRERPPHAKALELAEQLASVLAVAHAAGVVHRDLKPGNVMVTAEGALKVLDFGLSQRHLPSGLEAKAAASGTRPSFDGLSGRSIQAGLTTEGMILGTLQYMSPEQGRGDPVTAATDLFALGLILQELCTGEQAHPSGLDLHQLHGRVVSGTVTISPRLERDLGQLVRRLTAFEPEARPRAAEVLERIRWIRNRPKRILRRSVAAASVLVASLGVLKYTLDLRYHRNIAEGRADQAEETIDFMLGELRDRLVPLGRLDILNEVGLKALEYFRKVPLEELSDKELARNCQAVYDLGELRVGQGDLPGAMEFFSQALEFARDLVTRNPANDEWLWQLGQTQFWVGQVHYDQFDSARARVHWRGYLATARALVERDPARSEYREELAYAHTNLAALAQRAGDPREAEAGIRESLGIWRELAEKEPGNDEWQSEIADALSWLGSSLEEQQRFDEASESFRTEMEIRERLHALDPGNVPWEYRRSICLHHLAKVHQSAGRIEDASIHQDRALSLARMLCTTDPQNADWQRHLGVCLDNRAEILLLWGRAHEADEAAREASTLLGELCRRDPSNSELRLQRATTHLISSEAQLAMGDVQGARAALGEVARFLEETPELDLPTRTQLRARSCLLAGRAFLAENETEGARASFENGIAALDGLPREQQACTDPQRVRLLALLGRGEEARTLAAELGLHGYRDVALEEILAEGAGPRTSR